MLQMACHAWGYNTMSLRDAVGTIARLGFRHIDLGTGPHLDVLAATQNPKITAEHIAHLLQEFDLTLTDLYLMLPHINSPEPERRQQQFGLFKSLIPFAEALGTPGITVSPGAMHADGPDHSLARAVPALQQIIDLTADSDFRVSFELHLDSAASTPAQALQLLQAVPGLSLTLDIAHLITQGTDWEDIHSLFEHTAHIQIRQAAPGKLQTPFEEGILDIPKLLGALKEADYHGVLTIEYMTTFGWQGMMEVSISREVVQTRDAIRMAQQA
ncbi:MAG: sugar phosphate isomerase/epimerase [Chloroflexi bacterium]|nr:sugar phosphate isomerase/epimerase [Chloroflexota bacterium]